MEDFLLTISNGNTKVEASRQEASTFMVTSLKEWEKRSNEAAQKSLEESDLGRIPTPDQLHQKLMEEINARPRRITKQFWQEVPRKEGIALPPSLQQEVWFVPLMFILFWGFGMVLTSRFYYIVQATREFFYPKSRSNVFSDRITDEFGFKSAMTVLSLCTITIFCQLAMTNLFHLSGHEGLRASLQILLILIGFVSFKLLTSLYLCNVFFDRSTYSTVRHSYATLVFALSTILFPIVLIASFTAPMIARYALIAGCGICGIAILLYLYKILSIFFNGLTSIFYLILYLCTLEILPIAALVGLLLG